MFSKVAARASQFGNLTGVTARSFRATAAANNTKKPSIGDAVTILQSKVSGINQVVSILNSRLLLMFKSETKKIAPPFIFLFVSIFTMSCLLIIYFRAKSTYIFCPE